VTDPRLPCIIGVAQRTIHPEEGDAPEPLELWAEMCGAAAADTGGAGVLEAVDRLGVIYSLSWQYDDPAGRLANRLGLRAGSRHYSGLSGTSPQKFIQEAALEILEGRSDVAIVVGGEALATKKRLKRAGRKPDWSFRPAEKPEMPFDDPFHPSEIAHQVFQATLTFALFEVARRGHLGIAPEDYQRQVGETLAPLCAVAVENPRAWLRERKSATELVEVSPQNRMVSYPYPKATVSIMDIDMSAAVIIASHEKADALGVPADRRVYLRGWCYAKDPVYVAERDELWRSVGMEEASRAALASAGVGLDAIGHLDLYSCFASSLHFATDALGLAPDDPRGLTVTGGLPFHGGPGNDYMTHSVATMVERLRCDPSSCGMVSGVGMHMTNHVFGIYSATPGRVDPPDEAAVQARVQAAPRRTIRNTATGPAVVRTYSVVHSREGPVWGLAVCDLPEGERCYARVEDAGLMASMEESEWVGRQVALEDAGKGVNLIKA
jgi:acetyl-CoA C-acetyltransferase